MAVEAGRDTLRNSDLARQDVDRLLLASTSLPFAERQNACIVHNALRLEPACRAVDQTGSARAGLDGLIDALEVEDPSLVLASARARSRPASLSELRNADGAAGMLTGRGTAIAVKLGAGSINTDFVDQYRQAEETFSQEWEERWIREEGYLKLVPAAAERALAGAGLTGRDIDHFVMPCPLPKVAASVAGKCGIEPAKVVDSLADNCGQTGTAHVLLMLAHCLEDARPGQTILICQFGQGASALIVRTTPQLAAFASQPARRELSRGLGETNYLKLLVFNELLPWDRGMRGETDVKTALSTAYRNRSALLGFVAGKCKTTGTVHFPPSQLSHGAPTPAANTQSPYPLADRGGRVASRTADALAYSLHPPSCYGLVDFDGGGRLMMDFTDADAETLSEGDRVKFVFRIKDNDRQRHFRRYFWKAVRDTPEGGGV